MVNLTAALHARKTALQNAKKQNMNGQKPDISKEAITASLKAAGILKNNGQVATLVKSS